MPLVQSLDLLKRRVTSPVFRARARRRAREGAVGHGAVGRVRRARRSVSRASTRRRCWPASAAATSTRCCAATSSTRRSSRRVKRKTISALVYPAILISLALVLVSIIVLKVVPAFSDFYATLRRASCRSCTRIIVGVSEFLRAQFLLVIGAIVARGDRRSSPGSASRGSRRASIACCSACRCSARSRGSSRRRRWRGRWRRCSAAACRSSTRSTSRRKSVGNQYMARQLDIVSARVREGESFAAALEARQRVSRGRGEDGGSRRVDRRAAGHAEHRRRLLRRGDRHDHGAVRHAGRAGAARHHGHRDRRAAAGALHAAVPAELGAGADRRTWPPTHRTPICTPTRSTSARSATSTAAPSSSRRAGSPSATGSSSSTWTRSGSTRICSGRFRPI